jgi:hypothetical protein
MRQLRFKSPSGKDVLGFFRIFEAAQTPFTKTEPDAYNGLKQKGKVNADDCSINESVFA